MSDVRAAELPDDAGSAGHITPRIRYPAAGTIIALDPDIPATHQRVAFTVSPPGQDLRWQLDAEPLAGNAARTLWAPTQGHHVLVLQDAQGAALSQVEFDVRGSAAARAASP